MSRRLTTWLHHRVARYERANKMLVCEDCMVNFGSEHMCDAPRWCDCDDNANCWREVE